MVDWPDLKRVAVLLYPGVGLLEVAGPLAALGSLKNVFEPLLLAPEAGPVETSQGPQLVAETSYEDAPPTEWLLVPGGRLCVLNLARGDRGVERVVTAIVEAAWRFDARLTAGCRPVAVAERLPASAWSVRHRGRGHAFGIASDVLVAEALKPTI